MRQRLVNSLDTFVDCQNLPDADVARTIADGEIDLLVDSNGYFFTSPCLQVNYLGYSGTMGAPYIEINLVIKDNPVDT
jgi:protein O-GlcNAc transferase